MKPALWWLLVAVALWFGSIVLLVHHDGMWVASLLLGVLAGLQALDEEART